MSTLFSDEIALCAVELTTVWACHKCTLQVLEFGIGGEIKSRKARK